MAIPVMIACHKVIPSGPKPAKYPINPPVIHKTKAATGAYVVPIQGTFFRYFTANGIIKTKTPVIPKKSILSTSFS